MKKKRKEQKIAIVTDALVAPGGAERVLQALLKKYPEADIYTSVFNPKRFPWLKPEKVTTTFIQKLPFGEFWRSHYVLLSPIAFEQFRFDSYRVVVSLSAGCAKGVITRDDVRHVSIILTPPRNQWDGPGVRNRRSTFPLTRPLVDGYLRVWDTEAGYRPDQMVAISKYIQARISKVYKRDSEVIYPGVDISFWKRDPEKKREDFYLVVSRLYEYKRVDLAIHACNKLKKQLIIVGEGPERERLKRLSGKTINFTGYVSDEMVRSHLQRCKALVFPGIEDFGMVPVEAMACGAPVIAFNQGGVAEVVHGGETGILFGEQTVEALCEAMKNCDGKKWNHEKISKHAGGYSEKNFLDKITKEIERGR